MRRGVSVMRYAMVLVLLVLLFSPVALACDQCGGGSHTTVHVWVDCGRGAEEYAPVPCAQPQPCLQERVATLATSYCERRRYVPAPCAPVRQCLPAGHVCTMLCAEEDWVGPHNPWGHGTDHCGRMWCHHGFLKGGPAPCGSCIAWLMKQGMTQAAAIHAAGFVVGAGVGAALAPRPRITNNVSAQGGNATATAISNFPGAVTNSNSSPAPGRGSGPAPVP